jgi:hypothetical protein
MLVPEVVTPIVVSPQPLLRQRLASIVQTTVAHWAIDQTILSRPPDHPLLTNCSEKGKRNWIRLYEF